MAMNELNQKFFRNQRFLFVFDLDGTLLNSDKKISPMTQKIIKELVGLGNIVTMASGRPRRAIQPYFDELGLKGPFIGYNGALIVDPHDSSFPERKKMIPKGFVYDFFKRFPEEEFANFMIEDDHSQYYLRKNDDYLFFFSPEGIEHKIGSVFSNVHDDVISMVIQSHTPEHNHEIEDYIESHFDDLSIRFWSDAPCFGEIFFYSVNKSTSIDYVSRLYHIDREHIICFGDAMNDIEMIRKAGISFAMKNGADGLKREATYVTEYDNDSEGIYHALVSLFGRKD